ncbi:MAG: caspase family protein, partial [Burkholderiales bacterium]
MLRTRSAAALLLTLGMVTTGDVHATTNRIAMVIGNASYSRLPLKNPINDARAVAAALKDVGFEVIVRENAGYASMVDAMREFLDRSSNAQVRLVYFAGHGAQYRGKNYLVPVDASLTHDHELATKAANATELAEKLAQMKIGVNIMILDACREAPFPLVATRNPLRTRTVSPGLAGASAPQGTLIAFSTGPGGIALDGPPGTNSAYTRHLVGNLAEPGLPVEQLFKRIRIEVARDTNQKQIPWESSSLMGDFCFRQAPDGSCPSMPISVTP